MWFLFGVCYSFGLTDYTVLAEKELDGRFWVAKQMPDPLWEQELDHYATQGLLGGSLLGLLCFFACKGDFYSTPSEETAKQALGNCTSRELKTYIVQAATGLTRCITYSCMGRSFKAAAP